MRWRGFGQLPENRLFPGVHLRVRGKPFAFEMRDYRRGRCRNNAGILRPQLVLGFVIVSYFHARNVPVRVKSIRVSCEKQPHHIFDFVLSWTCVSSPMTASYSIIAGEFLPRMNTDEHGFLARQAGIRLKNRFAFPVTLYYHGCHAGPKGK
jgi:hypothetical protein